VCGVGVGEGRGLGGPLRKGIIAEARAVPSARKRGREMTDLGALHADWEATASAQRDAAGGVTAAIDCMLRQVDSALGELTHAGTAQVAQVQVQRERENRVDGQPQRSSAIPARKSNEKGKKGDIKPTMMDCFDVPSSVTRERGCT